MVLKPGPGTINLRWAHFWIHFHSLFQKEYMIEKWDWDQKRARLRFMVLGPGPGAIKVRRAHSHDLNLTFQSYILFVKVRPRSKNILSKFQGPGAWCLVFIRK